MAGVPVSELVHFLGQALIIAAATALLVMGLARFCKWLPRVFETVALATAEN